jgi:hypothetical protein
MAGAVQAAVRAAIALMTGGRRPAVWRPGVSADLARKWHSLPANRMFFMEARSKLSGPRSRRTYRRLFAPTRDSSLSLYVMDLPSLSTSADRLPPIGE